MINEVVKMTQDILEKFRDLIIDKNELSETIRDSLMFHKVENTIPINADNVFKLIKYYQDGRIALKRMIEWCDIIRYSEMYDYPEEENEQEVVAVVIDEIQDIEVFKLIISDDMIQTWLKMLEDLPGERSWE